MRVVGLAALLAASAVASTAQAGTYFVAGASDTNTFVVDEDTLRREGDVRAFVLITVVDGKDSLSDLGIDYVVEKEVVNCARDRFSYDYRIYYSSSREVMEKHTSPGDVAPIVSGSVMETVEKAVCADALSESAAADLLPSSTVAGAVEFIHARKAAATEAAAAAPAKAGVKKPATKRKRPQASGSQQPH
jgi:hypothetical protein